jgi:hypothetical protein
MDKVISLLAAPLLTETTLWSRIVIQGFELALLSIAVEFCFNGIRAGVKLFTEYRLL